MKYDLIVIGAGAAGMIASIAASKNGKKVLLLEKLPKIGAKLKATGGGKCNLTNTLSNEEFMRGFGKDGRFMQDALNSFDHKNLIDFFSKIGVQTHAPDGFRVFPISHNSNTILTALEDEIQSCGIDLLCSQRVEKLLISDDKITGVQTQDNTFLSQNIIISTGGLGYPTLGSDGDGYKLAADIGHTTTKLHPAMMPLKTKESWVKNCKADTIPKVEIKVDLKKAKKLKATGDLIFTNNGIRGPVVLDFAREITPLLEQYGEVPILLNLTKGMNEEQILQHLKKAVLKNPDFSILELLQTLLPSPISKELCTLAHINYDDKYNKIAGINRTELIGLLAWTPLTITGHDGFKMAMCTHGGINLKEINPKTMESKIIKGLYFCGEVMNLDGPCGGYNLQWSFSSGYLAGTNI